MTSKRRGGAGAVIAAVWFTCGVPAAGAVSTVGAAGAAPSQQQIEQAGDPVSRAPEETILSQLEAFNAGDIESGSDWDITVASCDASYGNCSAATD